MRLGRGTESHRRVPAAALDAGQERLGELSAVLGIGRRLPRAEAFIPPGLHRDPLAGPARAPARSRTPATFAAGPPGRVAHHLTPLIAEPGFEDDERALAAAAHLAGQAGAEGSGEYAPARVVVERVADADQRAGGGPRLDVVLHRRRFAGDQRWQAQPSRRATPRYLSVRNRISPSRSHAGHLPHPLTGCRSDDATGSASATGDGPADHTTRAQS